MTVARSVRQQRRLAAAAAEWQASGEEPGYLLHGPQLDQLAAWAAATDLSLHPSEQAVLDASVARRDEERSAEQHRQEEERRLRRKTRVRTRQLIGSAVVLALVAGLAAFPIVKRSEASGLGAKLTATDEARRLAAASTDARSNPELAALLALQALDTSRRHGQPALREARRRPPLGDPGRRASPTPDATPRWRCASGPMAPRARSTSHCHSSSPWPAVTCRARSRQRNAPTSASTPVP